jgi:hypothetical protein
MDTYMMAKMVEYNRNELIRTRSGRNWAAIFRKAR